MNYVSFDEAIWAFHDSQSLTPDEEYARDDIITRLQACLSRVCPGALLHPYGSQATGLQTKTSDIDLGFVFPPQMDQSFLEQTPRQQREMIVRVLLSLEPELTRNDWHVSPVLQAAVPIVKCTDKNGIEVDIAHLEPNSIVNADHIRHYMQIDIRVRPLLLAVKHWAKQRGINESTRGTLNSFGYCLMVIQYLQVVSPPVLPVLDINAAVEIPTRRPSLEEFQEKLQFWQKADGSATPTTGEPNQQKQPLKKPPPPPSVPVVTATLDESKMKSKNNEDSKKFNSAMLFESQNQSCVAELLFGFFKFYSEFDINLHCVDTNAGHVIPKNTVSLDVRRSALCVLDPTNPTNNVARSVRRWEWQSMETEFKRACETITLKHHLGQQCFDDLTELVETQEQQYRRIWQKTHVLARVRAEMELYRMNQQQQQHQNAAYQNEQYHREMQNLLFRVGLRARHSQTSGSHFTPSNYTPTSDTPNSAHSGQFTPNTLAHSPPYLSKSPSFHRSPGTVTPPAVSSLQLSSPARQYFQEMKPTDEEDPALLPLEPARSASGSGVPFNTHAYQSAGKTQGGRFRYDRINKMPWSKNWGK